MTPYKLLIHAILAEKDAKRFAEMPNGEGLAAVRRSDAVALRAMARSIILRAA